MHKLEVDDRLDYCQLEFDYAIRKGVGNFITVVMDVDMRRTASWNGRLGVLNQLVFIDFTDDSKMDSVAAHLANKFGIAKPATNALADFFAGINITGLPDSVMTKCTQEGIAPADFAYFSEDDIKKLGFRMGDMAKLKANKVNFVN